ncbi:MAG: YncE family protein [Sphingobacteriales bacterium]|nr:MAG: YncE family protein [Sphingobacteriales bacterium]TAF83857.1 MAG: YncE family protein [Sphingobacteriales bacterium]
MIIKKHTFKNTALLILVIGIFSCKKNNDAILPDIAPVRKGIFVLNEGIFDNNNSTLSYYDYDAKTLTSDIFKQENNRSLGDTGNDAQIYGSKMYIVVNGSSTLEILNAKTTKSIKQLDFKTTAGVKMEPRFIIFNNDKAFISSYDGTVAVLDTATLTIEKYITVGRSPEQMAVANGKLYVANSGGKDYPNYDNTVSVIDLKTLTEIKKITVTLNPNGVAADQYGDVYIKSIGNYDDVSPTLTIIDSKTDAVKTTFTNFNGGKMIIAGDFAFFTIAGSPKTKDTPAISGNLKVFNVKTETVEKEKFISDDTFITSPYGVNVDNLTGEVFITDAKNYASRGEVFCFDKDGKKKYALTTGISPNGVIFINK